MKKHVLASIIALSLGGISAAQAEVTLFDYKEASSSFEEAFIDGSFNTGKNRGDSQTYYNLNLNANYDRTISTPDRDLNYGGNISGSVDRAGTAGADSEDRYIADAYVSLDNYFMPGSNGAFWYGKAEVSKDSEIEDLFTAATVGVGYGRVTNVTPMAKTIRIMDELVRLGILTNKPAVGVYQDVARIIAGQDEYAARYGNKDYELKWISDIEAVLKNSGSINNISAAGALKARDVLLSENISPRRIGWKVRAGLGYLGSNFDGLTDKPLLELGGEYHMPLSKQTQFSNVATLNAVLNDGDDAYNFNNDLSLTYEVDDRIDWENSWQLNYAKSSGNGDDITTNTLSSGFAYELSNSLDATITATAKNIDGSTNATNPDGTDRALNVGVRYRLR